VYLRRSARTLVLFALWLLLIICGIWVSMEYEKTPARIANAAAQAKAIPTMPAGSSRSVTANSATPNSFCPNYTPVLTGSKQYELVMFAHPQCPCTKATLSELDRFLGRNNNVSTRVYFIVPNGFESWKNSENFKAAARIPGVEVRIDENGVLAEKFKACASGECFLFDRKATLLFHGGITVARGHEGDNLGLEQLSSIVEGRSLTAISNVVYGCTLFDAN
jgi:hypothetical protein